MNIEGEAVCAVGIQSVTAEGEQGVGVDVKRTSYHPEANNLLNLDEEFRGAIPSEILFSTWVRAFRTFCGYKFPVLTGGGVEAHKFRKHLHETRETT